MTAEKEIPGFGIPEQEKAVSKEGADLLYRLNRAVRIAKIYEPNNMIFIRQINLLRHLLEKILRITGTGASLMLRENTIYFNGVKLKFGYSNYYLLKFIQNVFHTHEIGTLIFSSGVSEEELLKFIQLMSSSKTGDDPFEVLLDGMRMNTIRGIVIEKLPYDSLAERKDRDAKKLFMLGITHLKEYFELQESSTKQSRLSLMTTKRLMQSIFNHITDNESFLFGLTNIKNFDEYTLNHSVNVCILSLSLGKKLGLDRNELIDLGLSSFFHDFGKLEIPKEILLKPGKLDDDERQIIERHPYYGAEMLIRMKEFSFLPLRALNVAMEHHAREDDTGYPRYTKKKSIDFYSKIVKIVDVFDAITTTRPYRKKNFTREEALRFMMERSGSEFDPIILKVFVNMMGLCPVGSLALLNTREIAIVFEANPDPEKSFRPRVKLITDPDGNRIDGAFVDLSEVDPSTGSYPRAIVKFLDPEKYGLKIADYFVAHAQ